ncbi:aldehyde dehydrogenase (NADP(+)) [Clavibacter michiganensis]|uniref:aldehyde dehydrogenase family protein n=1 Tax=Clavibacter michiganensis TaxID=28447 RepID=UPI000CE895B5|nr:aldehyde dehydrogenase family protein [Clavibacter michiganensis]PPF53733.1 aldehyde dehydrogenase (NADP(+)) [Clavibacter michiganensis]
MSGADTTAEAVRDAVARAAAAAPSAARATEAERAGWLRAIADDLDAARDALVPLAARETGLAVPRLTGEVARTTGQLRLFADAIEEGSHLEVVVDHADPSSAPPRPDLRRMLIPLGPVAVYAASNFPFAFSVAGGDTASALAVGCPVVVKAHPGHAETSRATAAIVAGALRRAGAPDGAFALVEGFDAGLALVDAAPVRAAAFTGSLGGGRAIADRAAARDEPIPFFGELGSLNPVVVTPRADAARGAELAAGLAASYTLGAGQFCTKPGLVLVPAGSTLERELPGQVPGGTAAMLTGSIAEGFVTGARRLAGIPGVEELIAPTVAGAAALLAVDAPDFAASADELTAEVFGPATLLVRYRSAEERDLAVAALPGSLTATLHAEPEDEVDALVDLLAARAGRLLFAGWPTGVAVAWAQHHGGPWPATTSQHTSVGVTAMRRFQRPIAYQDAPEEILPAPLRDGWSGPRRVDGRLRA